MTQATASCVFSTISENGRFLAVAAALSIFSIRELPPETN